MIRWNDFYLFAIATIILSVIAVAIAIYQHHFQKANQSKKPFAEVAMIAAILIFGSFIVGLWFSLERPPMRTMGETRLWYTLFLQIIGFYTWRKTKDLAVLSLSTTMSIVFIITNLAKPEIHQKEMMAALDSLWFIPHVVVYMFAYALIGYASLLAIIEAIKNRWAKNEIALRHCDQLVWMGTALLTLGMMMGALWAKQAWGDYWSWDPKEIWAAITWIGGLGYIHLRLRRNVSQKLAYGYILAMFILFQICWYGINYLPTAAQSVHTYFE